MTNTKTVIADFHNHWAIGFQDYWLNKQGYDREKLLEGILEVCFSKLYIENADIAICALTSEEDEIPRGSIHNRLGYLIENQLSKLPHSYRANTLSDKNNVLVAEKTLEKNRKVILVASQTVRLKDGKRHLVFGSDDVPNYLSFEDTLKYCKDRGLVSIAAYAFCRGSRKINREILEKSLQSMDAIEINAQPIMRLANIRARQFNSQLPRTSQKPLLANSDAHTFRGAFASCNYLFPDSDVDLSSENSFIDQQKQFIQTHQFLPVFRMQPLFDWLRYNLQMHRGLALKTAGLADIK